MRSWTPADVLSKCGACGHDILKGELYQLVRVPKLGAKGWIAGVVRKRCRACSDDSPELQRDVSTIQAPLGIDFTQLGKIDKPNLKDWKQLIAGREAEP
jgi:hypothetical protein